jgi:hypothetical protein
MSNHQQIHKVLVSALVLEVLCISYALYFPALGAFTSFLYLLSGLATGGALLIYQPKKQPAEKTNKTTVFYQWLLIPAIIIGMVLLSRQRILAEPLDYRKADMLPIIKEMCERFLRGQWSHIYDPIPAIWAGTVPIYLPCMWLPFSIPVALNIDPRWLTVLCFAMIVWLLIKQMKFFSPANLLLLMVLVVLMFWLCVDEQAGLLPFTEEGVVMLYYVLLVIAIQSRNVWLIGIMVSCCALSRYALIGWIPAMLLYHAFMRERKKLFQFVITGLLCFLLLVILPFGWKVFQNHLALPGSYIEFAGRVWKDAPEFMLNSPGLAKFFGPEKIALQHSLLIGLSLILPSLLMLLLLQSKKIPENARANFPLAVLKIALVIFYCLIDVPYLYLFYTSAFVSLTAIVYCMNGRQQC